MAFKRLSMRKIHRVLRLFFEAGLSIRAIARSIQTAPLSAKNSTRVLRCDHHRVARAAHWHGLFVRRDPMPDESNDLPLSQEDAQKCALDEFPHMAQSCMDHCSRRSRKRRSDSTGPISACIA